jgi:tetratricopeptide (TPR) repeat protein
MAATELDPPDIHHLRAAIGWLELGDASEAGEEIARITPANLEHPLVLKARWQICAAGQRWNAALPVAERMVEIAPDEAENWIQRAYTLRRAQGAGLQRAWDALMPALKRFPREPIIPFNLACYAAQFGRSDEALEWLQQAMDLAEDRGLIRNMALSDKDLESVWEKVRAW